MTRIVLLLFAVVMLAGCGRAQLEAQNALLQAQLDQERAKQKQKNEVRATANEFRTSTEIARLGQAVERYKALYGDYPPDFSELNGLAATDLDLVAFNRTAILRHIRKAFPKINPAEFTALKTYLKQEIAHSGHPPSPASALFFWLGGLSDDVQWRFTGAGGPLTTDANGGFVLRLTDRNQPVFEFDESQVVADSGQYIPKGLKAPFVYFNSDTYATAIFRMSENNVALPYVMRQADPTTALVSFARKSSFQIISAGRDDLYAKEILFNDNNGNPKPVYTTDMGRPFHEVEHPDPDAVGTNPAIEVFFEGQEDNIVLQDL
jgi:hypothetical protein